MIAGVNQIYNYYQDELTMMNKEQSIIHQYAKNRTNYEAPGLYEAPSSTPLISFSISQ